MIAAGLGFASACEASDIVDAVKAAADQAGIATSDIDCLCTIASKASATPLVRAADLVRAPIRGFPADTLAARNSDTLTHSVNSEEATGLASLAEAAALAGTGKGSHLLAPRVIYGLATCALATTEFAS